MKEWIKEVINIDILKGYISILNILNGLFISFYKDI